MRRGDVSAETSQTKIFEIVSFEPTFGGPTLEETRHGEGYERSRRHM